MIKYYRKGRAIVESSESTSYEAAKALLAKREAAVADGLLAARPGRVTAAAAFDDVIRDYRINGKRSLSDVEARVRLYLVPWFGARKLASISTADVRAYVDDRLAPAPEGTRKRVPTPATVNRELAVLKRAFTLAVRAGLVGSKPHIPMLAERNVRTGFLEREAFEAVTAGLPADVRAPMRFAYVTGWRVPSEVLTLQWRQVDRAAGIVRLEPGTTKNREGRVFVTAPLPELVDLLEGQWREHERLRQAGRVCPWVFPRADGQPMTAAYGRAHWARACRAAGVPGRIPHDLRRTAVRNLVRAGVSEKVAMLLTGHKTRSVFDRYDIVSEGDLRAAAEKLAMVSTTVSTRGTGRRGGRGNARNA